MDILIKEDNEITEEDNDIFGVENENFEEQNDVDNENELVEINDQNEENEGEENKKPEKVKRVVKNPRIVLNVDRLRGPKGLGALEGCFKQVKFKGRGHEEEDLTVLLKTYEYWCHRMYPKFPFKECIEKTEKLGTKGPIQTYLKKVRSGLTDEELPSTSEFVQEHDSENENNGEISQATNQSIIADIPIQLTEEQLETIRRNREKAEILRRERLRKIQEQAASLISEHNEAVADIIEENIENARDENENGKADDGLDVENIMEKCVTGTEEMVE